MAKSFIERVCDLVASPRKLTNSERAEVLAYAERVNARPAAVAVRAREAELAAAQATENTG